jgi:hypothetical protein
MISFTLKTETEDSIERSVPVYQTKHYHMPEDRDLSVYGREMIIDVLPLVSSLTFSFNK